MVVLVPWLVVTKDIAEIFSNNIMESDLRENLVNIKIFKNNSAFPIG